MYHSRIEWLTRGSRKVDLIPLYFHRLKAEMYCVVFWVFIPVSVSVSVCFRFLGW